MHVLYMVSPDHDCVGVLSADGRWIRSCAVLLARDRDALGPTWLCRDSEGIYRASSRPQRRQCRDQGIRLLRKVTLVSGAFGLSYLAFAVLITIGLLHMREWDATNQYVTGAFWIVGSATGYLCSTVCLRAAHMQQSSDKQYEDHPTVKVCRENNDDLGEAMALHSLAEAHKRAGNVELAIEYYSKALSVFKLLHEKLGSLFEQFTKPEAADQYPWILNICTEYMCLGKLYCTIHQHKIAIEYFTKALLIFRTRGDKIAEAECLLQMAKAYVFMGEYSEAIEIGRSALGLYKETGHFQGEAACLHALAASRSSGDQRDELTALRSLSTDYHELGQYAKADEWKRAAEELAGTVDQGGAVASNENPYPNEESLSLGDGFFRAKQYAHAIETYTQALALTKEAGDRRGECQCLHRRGECHEWLDEHEKAVENYTRALDI
eukprot:3889674-Prymnesium_polylepis.1